MSFEGYYQKLCAKGHLRCIDCISAWYDPDEETEKCDCGEPFVFQHVVDETNCEGVQYPFEIATEAEYTECNLGHRHETKERTYKIPQAKT